MMRHYDTTYSGQKHDAQECPDAEAMEAACSPWYRSVVRDPGDYVGRHREPCTNCHGDGGWWFNPDWPMGDAQSREWEKCPCGTDNPTRRQELWVETHRDYEIARYGHSHR